MKVLLLTIITIVFLAACNPSKNIAKSARQNIINDKALVNANVGISIYEPLGGKYIYNYQGDKYFVPASNTKLATCYAAMKYLEDSLVGLKYGYSKPDSEVLVIQPTGDPTFLHDDFKRQPVWDFLLANSQKYKDKIAILDTIWQDERWGNGWSWNDYDSPDMAERNTMPVFGNVLKIELRKQPPKKLYNGLGIPVTKLFKTQSALFDSLINGEFENGPNFEYWSDDTLYSQNQNFRIVRDINSNYFKFKESKIKYATSEIPFVTMMDTPWGVISHAATAKILADTLKYQFGSISKRSDDSSFTYTCASCKKSGVVIGKWIKIHTQPTDSMLKPMMHRSDNFFAEQTLLMISNEKLGVMNDARIIDTLLKTIYKDLPQKPVWVDGSGLSRYNLFTPQDMITILNKMRVDFGMDRIKEILATGGEGTLRNYYKPIQGFIFAKTGTLSGVVALSGFLYTKKNKLLIFSVLVNNHNSSVTEVRKAVEKFVSQLREKN